MEVESEKVPSHTPIDDFPLSVFIPGLVDSRLRTFIIEQSEKENCRPTYCDTTETASSATTPCTPTIEIPSSLNDRVRKQRPRHCQSFDCIASRLPARSQSTNHRQTLNTDWSQMRLSNAFDRSPPTSIARRLTSRIANAATMNRCRTRTNSNCKVGRISLGVRKNRRKCQLALLMNARNTRGNGYPTRSGL